LSLFIVSESFTHRAGRRMTFFGQHHELIPPGIVCCGVRRISRPLPRNGAQFILTVPPKPVINGLEVYTVCARPLID